MRLCYFLYNRRTCSIELKIAYSPRGSFNLRDFHRAVHNLPTDAFLFQCDHSEGPCHSLRRMCTHFDTLITRVICPFWHFPAVVKLSSVLRDEVLYSWGGKNVPRKAIFLGSCLVKNIGPAFRKVLMDAGEKCISVEFVLLEPSSSHLGGVPEDVNNFIAHICDLENCSFQNCLPDPPVLNILVKRWLLELKEEKEEPMRAQFVFKSNLAGSLNRITCSLSRSVCDISDCFRPRTACRCHGVLLDGVVKRGGNRLSCPVTNLDLETSDLMESYVKVGEHGVFFLPSSLSLKCLQVSSSVTFSVVKRINLGSLSEGVISGPSYFVTPSTHHEIDIALDEHDKAEFNALVFKGLCSALHSLDQGLLCSSDHDIGTLRDGLLQSYYILQPSDGGPMLLRQLVGSEEFLPVPQINQLNGFFVSQEMEDSIQACLLMTEACDYNPFLHERGFHRTVNLLVKESFHFGTMVPLEDKLESDSTQPGAPEGSFHLKTVTDQVGGEVAFEGFQEEVTGQWEQLIVSGIPKIPSPDRTAKPEQPVVSPAEGCTAQLDERTSRILERLEIPRQL